MSDEQDDTDSPDEESAPQAVYEDTAEESAEYQFDSARLPEVYGDDETDDTPDVYEDEADPLPTTPSDDPDPFSSLATQLERREDEYDPLEDEFFSKQQTEGIDIDELFDRLKDGIGTEKPADAEPQYREIDKSKYCHQCPHLSTPPTLECTHDGTEILEMTDLETFRVVDCPVILEDERLRQ